MNDKALTKIEPQPLAVAAAAPSVGEMLQAVIAKGVTGESVAAVEQLVNLYERMEAKNAEKAFNVAFNQLQQQIPIITATSVIPNRGKYERFEDIMRVVGPLLVRNGFSVSFSMDFKENRILETCHLRHIGGHSQSNSFAVRSGGKADSDTQADCKAATTAKRNALLNALNISIQQDCLNEEQDPRMEGGTITEAQAFELERRVALTHSDHQKFLAFAGAKTYTEIATSKYPILDQFLSKKERQT